MSTFKASDLIPKETKTVAYLSAAPRVSTHLDAEAGGPRTHVLGVIQSFRALGWEVKTFIAGDRVPAPLMANSEDKLQRSLILRLGADVVRVAMGAFQSLWVWEELHGKVDLIYERFATLQSLGWILQSEKTPWVLETNGVFYYEAKTERRSIVLSEAARLMEMWAYRRCDVLVCITNELKDLIVDVTGVSPAKILVVPNGVDVERFNPKLYFPNRLFDGLTIGFVGSLINWHRLDVLLMALSELLQDGVEFNLVVVGDGKMRCAWEELARRLRLLDRVRFVGRVPWDKVAAYVSGFDIGFVGSSPMEIGAMYHSPLKLYEYMAMSLPVISAMCADAREMISPGVTGYTFVPADKEDLKRALRLAMRNKDRWKEMGRAARELVITRASWDARVRTMIEGINQILEKRVED